MNTGDIGERYVHNELTRKGIVHAYLANSSTQKDWDIAVFKKISDKIDEFKLIKIQVKAMNWKNEKSRVINGSFSKEIDFDFLCIVVLNYSESEPYISYLLPKDKLKSSEGCYELFDKKEGTIQYTNRTITLNLLSEYKDDILNCFKDTWKELM